MSHGNVNQLKYKTKPYMRVYTQIKILSKKQYKQSIASTQCALEVTLRSGGQAANLCPFTMPGTGEKPKSHEGKAGACSKSCKEFPEVHGSFLPITKRNELNAMTRMKEI